MSNAQASHKNRLADEKSPYLLQHASNPVDWYPWGVEALQIAKDQNRPIFISIGYSTCHWCHVMAHESFEDAEVARRLNDSFISVKVDREERPDIDAAYMQACQLLNRHGGWPLNLFLTPDGKPFYALTYAPKHGRGNQPGFIAIIEKVAEIWKDNPENLIEGGQQLSNAIQQMEKQNPQEELNEQILIAAARNFSEHYDRTYAGFGAAPKFPQPHNTTLLLRLAQRFSDGDLERMALSTLDAIEQGGITDQIGGGIHRYSVDERWLVPHFEKMLYDQALITEAYLDAWQATNDNRYAKAAADIFDYVLRELQHPDGGFYCGEDADSEGAEGTCYLWTPAQIEDVLTEEDAELCVKVYNLSERGNFEGSNILHRTAELMDIAEENGLSNKELEERLEQIKRQLLKQRDKRPRPHLDDKVLTGWNGLMVASLARAGSLLERPDYLDAAKKAVSFIRSHLTSDGRLQRRYRDSETAISAFHEDYAYFTHGLIELFFAEPDPTILEFALDCMNQCIELFEDSDGGFYDSAEAFVEGMGRGRSKQDGAVPAAASVTALNLLRLARLVGRNDLEEKSQKVLSLHLAQAGEYPTAFAYLLTALNQALTSPLSLVVVSRLDPLPKQWRTQINNFRPTLPVLVLPQGHSLSGLVPAAAGKELKESDTTAWFCNGNSCLAPVDDAAKLAELLDDQIPLNTFNR